MTEPSPLPTENDGTRTEPRTVPRRRFLLGRLAEAVRRQDWFTVLVEITIVVLGIVIGFQVTAWGQGRADRAQEQAYLVQLEGDLHETLRRVEDAETRSAPRVRAGALLMRAYRMPEPPPEDSLLRWLSSTFNYDAPHPVVATAEALVATGDLALVRDDSLRRAIPAYLSQTRETLSAQADLVDGQKDTFVEATRFLDFWDLFEQTRSPAVIDSLAQASDAVGLPAGPRTRPFPFRATDLLGDREVYRTLYLENVWQTNLQWTRREMREEAEHLMALVQSARGSYLPGGLPPDTTARRP